MLEDTKSLDGAQMITEIRNTAELLQQCFNSNFTKFQLAVFSIGRFVLNFTGVPTFIANFSLEMIGHKTQPLIKFLVIIRK